MTDTPETECIFAADISFEQARRAALQTSFDPEGWAKSTITSYCHSVCKIYQLVLKECTTPEEVEHARRELTSFRKYYSIKYSIWLNAHAQCSSVLITGSAKFNSGKTARANERERKKFEEAQLFKGRVLAKILSDIRKRRQPAPDRCKESLVKTLIIGHGIEVINNVEMQRIQVSFEDKPSEEVRTALKDLGFKWSPKQSVWQRKNTRNAFLAIKHPECLIDHDPELATALRRLAEDVLNVANRE